MAQETNKKLNQRKIVPNNSNNTEEDQKKRPKFNIYWIYGLIFALIIGYNFYGRSSTGGVETDIESFKELLKQGDVNEIKEFPSVKTVSFQNRDFIIPS